MSQNTVPFDTEHVQAYLDRCIQFWREQDRDGNVVALDYIDAFQSIRMSLFGELLPAEDLQDTRGLTPHGAVKPIQGVVWFCFRCANTNPDDWQTCVCCDAPRPS